MCARHAIISCSMRSHCSLSFVLVSISWFLVSEPGFFWLAGTFETFWFEVEDLKELGPFTETLKWNLSPGMGFDGRKDHPMTENIRKCLKIQISKILVDNLMNFLWFWDKTQCIRLLPTRSTQRTPPNLLIPISKCIFYWFFRPTRFLPDSLSSTQFCSEDDPEAN